MDDDSAQSWAEWVRAALWASPAVIILIIVFFFFILPKILPGLISQAPADTTPLTPDKAAERLSDLQTQSAATSSASTTPAQTPEQAQAQAQARSAQLQTLQASSSASSQTSSSDYQSAVDRLKQLQGQ